MGVPAVEVSVTPMLKSLPNILDLPLISTFVKMAIAAGTAEYVAPKSMTLNMQELLSGAAIGDTRAVGVFIITIHHAEDLSIQDKSGTRSLLFLRERSVACLATSDIPEPCFFRSPLRLEVIQAVRIRTLCECAARPCHRPPRARRLTRFLLFSSLFSLAYAKFGKPLYSTRIIMADLNPVFEETCALLLTADEVKSEESLSLMLWDSDSTFRLPHLWTVLEGH